MYTVIYIFNPYRPIILKTEWIASGVSWIIMRPDYDLESLKYIYTLITYGTLLFDLPSDNTLLRPVQYGSCTFLDR